jgi:hypothetical protein
LLLLPSITVSNEGSFFYCTFSNSTFFSCTFTVIGDSFCFFSSSFEEADLANYFFPTLSSFFIKAYLTGEEKLSAFFTSTDATLATGTTTSFTVAAFYEAAGDFVDGFLSISG